MTQKEFENLKEGDIIKNLSGDKFEIQRINYMNSPEYEVTSVLLTNIRLSLIISEPAIAVKERYNRTEETENLKYKYWKNGNIFDMGGSCIGVISNNNLFAYDTVRKEHLTFCIKDFSDSLNFKANMCYDIVAVYKNTATHNFNVFDINNVKYYCTLLWKRYPKIEMTIEEIEEKLGLQSGTLKIV